MNRGEAGGGSEHPLDGNGAIAFNCADEVAKRIAQLYGDERLCDVVFVVRGQDGPERRFVGHRNIISTWSRPLDRMLCGDFAESASREVCIHDVDPAAFEALLELMYCGTVKITVDNVLAILDASVRFDVAPLVQFSVQFLQNHTSSEHACRMLEVGVQYGLVKLMDKCIELIVTDDHIRSSDDFTRLSQAAVVELAKHSSWNMHEDDIYDIMVRWGWANSNAESDFRERMSPILEQLRYPHMSVEKLKSLTNSAEVPHHLIFDALFFKLHHSGPDDNTHLIGKYRPREGSLLFTWVPTSKVTVSGNSRENARHTSSNGFTGVRGDRRMQHGVYTWTIDIAETQSAWIFVGVAQAEDPNDVAWRSTGRMLYCLDSRFFHQGSGQNHPNGDRKIGSGDTIRVVLDCTRHTLAFGVNGDKPIILFRDLPHVAYVPAVDLRDCGDKVRLLSSLPYTQVTASTTDPPGPLSAVGPTPMAASTERPAAAGRTVDVGLGRRATDGQIPLLSGDPSGGTPSGVTSGSFTGTMNAMNSPFSFSAPWASVPSASDVLQHVVPGRRTTVASAETLVPQHAGGYSNGAPSVPKAAAEFGPAPLGIAGGSTRMSQPRQSQGSHSGVPPAAAAAASAASADTTPSLYAPPPMLGDAPPAPIPPRESATETAAEVTPACEQEPPDLPGRPRLPTP